MKKIYLLLLSFICLCTMSAFAGTNCNKPCEKPIKTYSNPCNEPCTTAFNSCFLCTKADKDNLFKQMNLSATQICSANKIQDKYEQEVLSLTERIKCEHENLCRLKTDCSSKSKIRHQKRTIKRLENKLKDICKCYEDQFKALISRDQEKIYNKYKK